MIQPANIRSRADDLIFQTRERLNGASNATPQRLENVERALKAFSTGAPVADSLPYSLFIEASSRCNLSCPLCPTGSGSLSRPAQDMDFDGYASLIDEVAETIFEVHFAFFGEPTLNNLLPKMVQLAAGRGVTTRLMTNGTLLTQLKVQALVASGLDRVTVSVDGLDQQTYEKYRVGGTLQRVLEAIRGLRNERERHGGSIPYIEAQFLALRHNESSLKRARNELLDSGADIVKIKSASLELVDLPDAKLRDYLPEDSNLHYYNMSVPGRPRFRYASNADSLLACPSMYLEPGIIMSSGMTAMCCRYPNGDHGYGSAFQGGFRTTWDGLMMQEFRQQFSDPERRFRMCRACPILSMPSFLVNHGLEECDS